MQIQYNKNDSTQIPTFKTQTQKFEWDTLLKFDLLINYICLMHQIFSDSW